MQSDINREKLAIISDYILPGKSSAMFRTLIGILLCCIGIIAIAISAKIRVPFWPVPITMQTFAITMIGMTYGLKYGTLTIIGYLFAGILGFDVFAGTAGDKSPIEYMMGGTGGYLVGFVLATMFMGACSRHGRGKTIFEALFIILISHAIIYILGILWLGNVYGWGGNLDIMKVGFYNFVLSDLLKIALASTTLPLIWNTLDKHRGYV